MKTKLCNLNKKLDNLQKMILSRLKKDDELFIPCLKLDIYRPLGITFRSNTSKNECVQRDNIKSSPIHDAIPSKKYIKETYKKANDKKNKEAFNNGNGLQKNKKIYQEWGINKLDSYKYLKQIRSLDNLKINSLEEITNQIKKNNFSLNHKIDSMIQISKKQKKLENLKNKDVAFTSWNENQGIENLMIKNKNKEGEGPFESQFEKAKTMKNLEIRSDSVSENLFYKQDSGRRSSENGVRRQKILRTRSSNNNKFDKKYFKTNSNIMLNGLLGTFETTEIPVIFSKEKINKENSYISNLLNNKAKDPYLIDKLKYGKLPLFSEKEKKLKEILLNQKKELHYLDQIYNNEINYLDKFFKKNYPEKQIFNINTNVNTVKRKKKEKKLKNKEYRIQNEIKALQKMLKNLKKMQ